MTDEQIKEIVIACIENKSTIYFARPIHKEINTDVETCNEFNAKQIVDFINNLKTND